MKKSILKLIPGVVMITMFSYTVASQSFEGIIEFKKASATDTTKYIYFVKENKVRVDEIGSRSHEVEGTFMVNLDAKTMTSINYKRKLYMDQPSPSDPLIQGTCSVQKGQNVKMLQGYKCVDYVVTNNTEGTIITYWLADGQFAFFDKLLHQLNRKDKASVYFLQIPDVKNMFPMLSVQTDLTGKEISRLEVTKITKRVVDNSMYDIPKGYKKFEK